MSIAIRPARASNDPSYLLTLQGAAHEKHLAETPMWRRLLHDRRSWSGGEKSDIDDPSFFFSPKGRTDPSAELDATLAAFFDPPAVDTETLSAQCRFPARYAWLNEQLHFDPSRLTVDPCPRYQAWESKMNAGGVSVIFASYYMNNPSSMYGHPFLLLNGAGTPPPPILLDYTVSYAADVTTSNGFLFALYGLGGLYRGRFSTMPYYIKVRVYSDMESRDLWQYDLTLSSAAVQRLVEHVWELEQTSIAYYFFTQNCAYEILPLLEVADPHLNVSGPFRLKTIPSDVLRAITAQPGLVKAVHQRPSFVSQTIARRARLSPEEIRVAERLVKEKDLDPLTVLAGKPVERQALILDSAYDYFRLRNGFERDPGTSADPFGSRLLLARNRLGPVSLAPLNMPSEISPDLGHPSGRMAVSYGFSNHSHFEELSLRPAFQDQDDPPQGYLPGSQLEMFHLRLRYDNDRSTVYVREFSLVNILSLSPFDPWKRDPSWAVKTGLDTALDLGKDPENSLYYGLSGGVGFALPMPLGHSSMLYALGTLDTGAGHVFEDGYRAGAGGEVGFLFTIASFWRVDFSGSYTRYPVGNVSGKNVLKLVQGCPLRKNLEARFTLDRENNYKEVLVGVLWYL